MALQARIISHARPTDPEGSIEIHYNFGENPSPSQWEGNHVIAARSEAELRDLLNNALQQITPEMHAALILTRLTSFSDAQLVTVAGKSVMVVTGSANPVVFG